MNPPDPSVITAPELFENAWVFPASWPPAVREVFTNMRAELDAEQGRLEAARAEAQALAAAPEAQIAAIQAEVRATRERREAEVREREDEAAWVAALAKHGAGHVDRIFTEGGTVILKSMSEAQADLINARAEGVAKAAANDPEQAAKNFATAQREGLIKHALVYPAEPRFRAIMLEWPGTWIDAFRMRDALLRGRRQAEGKGGAPI